MAVTKQLYGGGQLYSIVEDNINTAVTDVISLTHTTAGTVSNNIGTGIEIDIETSTTLTEAGSIDAVLTDKTTGNEDSKILINLLSGGTDAFLTMAGTSILYPSNLRVVADANLNGAVNFGNLASDETTVHATLPNSNTNERTAITFEGPKCE